MQVDDGIDRATRPPRYHRKAGCRGFEEHQPEALSLGCRLQADPSGQSKHARGRVEQPQPLVVDLPRELHACVDPEAGRDALEPVSVWAVSYNRQARVRHTGKDAGPRVQERIDALVGVRGLQSGDSESQAIVARPRVRNGDEVRR